MTKKCKMSVTTDGKHHFFASSCLTWRTSCDVAELITNMKAEGVRFHVWMVPGTLDTQYDIFAFCPQVEGAQFLAFYSPEQ